MLLSIAASMYYLEDQSNGLFIWWKTPFGLARDFAYYVVIMLIPSIMVLIGLWYGGVFTSFGRELLAILVYDCVLIVMASIFREIIGSIKGLGIITPILIMSSALLSPVFIDLKEGRSLQRICPTFHYLYCIHDLYYVKILSIYGLLMVLTWYIIHIVLKNTKLL
jgi:ABC-2 type transport system permease protein